MFDNIRNIALLGIVASFPLSANELLWNLAKTAQNTPENSPEWHAVEQAFYLDPLTDLSFRKSIASRKIETLIKKSPYLYRLVTDVRKACLVIMRIVENPDKHAELWKPVEAFLEDYPKLLDWNPPGHANVRSLLRIFNPRSKFVRTASDCVLWNALTEALHRKDAFRFAEFDVIAQKCPHLLAYRPDEESENIIQIAQVYHRFFVEALRAPLPFRQDYYGLGELGRGAFGEVSLGLHRRNNQLVAIKMIRIDGKQRDFGWPPREIEIMRKLGNHNNPNLVKMIDVLIDDAAAFLVMDYIQAEQLQTYSSRLSPLPEADCIHIVSQIVCGISFLHAQGICHRDLALKNVLIDQAKRIKVIDMGLGNFMEESLKLFTQCGTAHYAPPEAIATPFIGHDGPPRDVWAIGVILFKIAARDIPFGTTRDILGIQYEWPARVKAAERIVEIVARIFQPAETRITLEGLRDLLE